MNDSNIPIIGQGQTSAAAAGLEADLVICDIDGTLADCSHRLSYLQTAPKDWQGFFREDRMLEDRLILPVFALLCMLVSVGARVVFVSGRPESRREVTYRWMARTMGSGWSAIPMILRADDDFREDHVFKADILQEIESAGSKSQILFVLEDRSRVVDMWRENGVPCFQVAAGNY